MVKLTESIVFSMATPNVIDVPWAKGKCDTYTLSAYGLLFLGHMHPPGRDFLYSTSKEFHQDIMFMFCRERGCSNWSLCAQSIKKFNIISHGVTYRCELVLMIGVNMTAQNMYWTINTCNGRVILENMITFHKPCTF